MKSMHNIGGFVSCLNIKNDQLGIDEKSFEEDPQSAA